MISQQPLRCVLVGCGQVAHEYLTTLREHHDLDLVSCVDIDVDRAKAFAARHAVPGFGPPEDELSSGRFDLAVILTPPSTHVDLARQVLDAGAHVYVEKPLGHDPIGADALLNLARTKGLLVSAAPDTVLAPPTRAALNALESGAIGNPIAADAALLARGPESWNPTPQPFYADGVGPLADMGPYYLSTLVSLLGPVDYVEATATRITLERTIQSGPEAGQTFVTAEPTHVTALLHTASDTLITMTTSFDIAATQRPHVEIYGTDGTLVLPDPNFHHGPVRYRRKGSRTWQDLNQVVPTGRPIGRGMGVLDLVDSIRHGADECVSGRRAHHVVEIIDAIRFASKSGHPADLALLPEERRAGVP